MLEPGPVGLYNPMEIPGAPIGTRFLDDATVNARAWYEEARRLDDGNSPDAAMARLDAMAAGLSIRRRLDALDSDPDVDPIRRAVVARLAELERRTIEDLATIRPGTPAHREVARRSRQWLGEARVAAQNARTVLEFEPVHQAMAIEALRSDLEWLGVVIARLDGEPPPAPSLWIDAELERLRERL